LATITVYSPNAFLLLFITLGKAGYYRLRRAGLPEKSGLDRGKAGKIVRPKLFWILFPQGQLE